MDWATILAQLAGSASPSPQPLDMTEPLIRPTPDFVNPGQVTGQPHEFGAAPTVLPEVQGPGGDVLPLSQAAIAARQPAPGPTGDPSGGRGTRAGREGDGSVGAALVPLPRPRPQSTEASSQARTGGPTSIGGRPLGAQGPIQAGGPGGHQPFGGFAAQEPGAAAQGFSGGKFAEALKGVRAPAAPDVVKPSSPNAPRPTSQIKGGELQALLAMLLSGGGGGAARAPTTLGRSVGG